MTEMAFSLSSFRYTFRTRTRTIIRPFASRNKLVIFPVNAKYPLPENVGNAHGTTKSSLEATHTVPKRQNAARAWRKILAICILQWSVFAHTVSCLNNQVLRRTRKILAAKDVIDTCDFNGVSPKTNLPKQSKTITCLPLIKAKRKQ